MEKTFIASPIGNLKIVANGDKIIEISFCDNCEQMEISNNKRSEILTHCADEISAYFRGEISKFSVKFKIEGSDFEKSVYEALLKIPYGEVLTYKQLATKINRPKAYRAVGNANAKNKIPIIIPCHRVVASNGIGGYSGGLWRKNRLLKLEKAKLKF